MLTMAGVASVNSYRQRANSESNKTSASAAKDSGAGAALRDGA